jgi:hypothetical protein
MRSVKLTDSRWEKWKRREIMTDSQIEKLIKKQTLTGLNSEKRTDSQKQTGLNSERLMAKLTGSVMNSVISICSEKWTEIRKRMGFRTVILTDSRSAKRMEIQMHSQTRMRWHFHQERMEMRSLTD